MSDSERVTVIIPNWNGERFIGECLGALAAQTSGPPRVIVVDNASTDNSRALIKSAGKNIELIESDTNEGFARAVNRGIRAARAEFVALLNNDAVPDADWLACAVAALDANSDCSSIACRIVSYDDPGTIDSAGDYFTPWGRPGNRGHGERDGAKFDLPARVFGPCAAAAIYRKSLFDDIGLFDENFFAYYEDADLNLRAALAGRTCLYVPGARVRHRYSASSHGTTSKLGVEEVYIHITGVAAKNMPLGVLVSAPLRAVAFHSAAILFFLLARLRKRNRLPRVRFFQFFRAMFAQRPEVAAKKKVSNAELRRLFKEEIITGAVAPSERVDV